jgi:predicted alpha/beta hydrolase family esterase
LKLLGLHKISSREANKAIIFVHGLNGDANKTWQKKDEKPFPNLLDEDEQLSGFEIYTFGYRTGFFLKRYDIDQIAKLLTTEVTEIKSKDLYFIVHSMGGIVTQNMIIDLVNSENIEFSNRIRGIVYLAVPFMGSMRGTRMSVIASLIPPIIGKWIFSVQVLSLKVFSKELLVIRNRWSEILDQNKLPKYNHRAIIGGRDGTVPEFSSTPDYIKTKDRFSVDTNHITICKVDKKHKTYTRTVEFLNSIIEKDKYEITQLHKNYGGLSFLTKELENIIYQLNRVRKQREFFIKSKVSPDTAKDLERWYKNYEKSGYASSYFKEEDPYYLISTTAADDISYLANLESYDLLPINSQIYEYEKLLDDERLKATLLVILDDIEKCQQSISKEIKSSIYKIGVYQENISKADEKSFQTKLDQAELEQLKKENSTLYTNKKGAWKHLINNSIEFELVRLNERIKNIIIPKSKTSKVYF